MTLDESSTMTRTAGARIVEKVAFSGRGSTVHLRAMDGTTEIEELTVHPDVSGAAEVMRMCARPLAVILGRGNDANDWSGRFIGTSEEGPVATNIAIEAALWLASCGVRTTLHEKS